MNFGQARWTILLGVLLAAAGPVSAGFLSPDPAPADQENFNRYWYASDNPYTFVDPDGRYTCPSNGNECNTFDQAIANARTAGDSPRLTAEQQATLTDSANFFGQKGDPNVEVRFADLKGDYGQINTNTEGKGSVTFDLEAIAGKRQGESALSNGLAMRLLHEGNHGVRIMEEGFPDSRHGRFDREVSAHHVEALYQKAAQFLQNSNNLWAPWIPGDGISERNVIGRANFSVDSSCAGSNKGSCR